MTKTVSSVSVIIAALLLVIPWSGVSAEPTVRFADSLSVDSNNQKKAIVRAIRSFQNSRDGFLVAWVSLDPQILEMSLDPTLLHPDDQLRQDQRIARAFDLVMQPLFEQRHLVYSKNSPLVYGASKYVKINQIAFRRLLRTKIVTDVLIVGEEPIE